MSAIDSKTLEFLAVNNLKYVENPVNFIYNFNKFFLVYSDVSDIEKVDHFNIAISVKTSHEIKTKKSNGQAMHIDQARSILGKAIEQQIDQMMIIHVIDHNGKYLYLGVENGQPFKMMILQKQEADQIPRMIDNSPKNLSCTFELLSGFKDSPSTSITLELNWISSKVQLFEKPGVDAQAILHVNFVCGEKDSETHQAYQHLWKSVLDLYRFDDAIKNGDFLDGSFKKSQKILDFLDSYTRNQGQQEDLEKRQDYDFTDYFWEFIQDVESKEDMIQVMTAVVEALETQSLIPYISANNKTAFAKTLSQHVSLSLKNICKKSDQDSLFQIYDSWIQDPIPILFEVGIRKCFLDISHCFQDYNIVKAIPPCSDISSLKSILSILDLSTCLSQHALGLPHDLAVHIIKSILPYKVSECSLSITLSSFSTKVLGWIRNTCSSFDYKTWCFNDGISYYCFDLSEGSN